MSCIPQKSYSSAVLSSPDILADGAYSILLGGETASEAEAGFAGSGSLSEGTLFQSIQMEGLSYSMGGYGGIMGGFGGRGGNKGMTGGGFPGTGSAGGDRNKRP